MFRSEVPKTPYETRMHSMRVMCHVSHVHRVCMQACSVDALRETSPVINTNHNNAIGMHYNNNCTYAIDVLTTDQYLPRMSAECQYNAPTSLMTDSHTRIAMASACLCQKASPSPSSSRARPGGHAHTRRQGSFEKACVRKNNDLIDAMRGARGE